MSDTLLYTYAKEAGRLGNAWKALKGPEMPDMTAWKSAPLEPVPGHANPKWTQRNEAAQRTADELDAWRADPAKHEEIRLRRAWAALQGKDTESIVVPHWGRPDVVAKSASFNKELQALFDQGKASKLPSKGPAPGTTWNSSDAMWEAPKKKPKTRARSEARSHKTPSRKKKASEGLPSQDHSDLGFMLQLRPTTGQQFAHRGAGALMGGASGASLGAAIASLLDKNPTTGALIGGGIGAVGGGALNRAPSTSVGPFSYDQFSDIEQQRAGVQGRTAEQDAELAFLQDVLGRVRAGEFKGASTHNYAIDYTRPMSDLEKQAFIRSFARNVAQRGQNAKGAFGGAVKEQVRGGFRTGPAAGTLLGGAAGALLGKGDPMMLAHGSLLGLGAGTALAPTVGGVVGAAKGTVKGMGAFMTQPSLYRKS